MKKYFFQRVPLNRSLAKTLRIKQNCLEKFLKNLAFGVALKSELVQTDTVKQPIVLCERPNVAWLKFMDCGLDF